MSGSPKGPAGSEATLRVLFASTHSHLPQRVGGIESNTHEHCLELRARGHVPAVMAALEPRGWLWLRNRTRSKLPGGSSFPADRTMGYRTYRGWDMRRGPAETVARFEPSLVVTQGSAPVPLMEAFLELDVPTVLYLHDVEFHRLGGEVPADPRLLVLANSRYTASRARRDLGLESHMVPPLIRPDVYRVTTSREKVLFVNPHPWKGADIALHLAEHRPDVPFLFVESWKLGEQVRREYRARGAALPNVEWSAPVSDMRQLYRRARLVLVPSVWEETWGRVATEAQVSGIPVLASYRGGLPESVGPGGILVDPEADREEWLDALSRLWDDAAEYERLSEAALVHSRRPEIQPAVLSKRLVELMSAHAAMHGIAPARALPILTVREPSTR